MKKEILTLGAGVSLLTGCPELIYDYGKEESVNGTQEDVRACVFDLTSHEQPDVREVSEDYSDMFYLYSDYFRLFEGNLSCDCRINNVYGEISSNIDLVIDSVSVDKGVKLFVGESEYEQWLFDESSKTLRSIQIYLEPFMVDSEGAILTHRYTMNFSSEGNCTYIVNGESVNSISTTTHYILK